MVERVVVERRRRKRRSSCSVGNMIEQSGVGSKDEGGFLFLDIVLPSHSINNELKK